MVLKTLTKGKFAAETQREASHFYCEMNTDIEISKTNSYIKILTLDYMQTYHLEVAYN